MKQQDGYHSQKIRSLRMEKLSTLKIARELYYDERTIEEIKDAKTIKDVQNALTNGRIRKFKR